MAVWIAVVAGHQLDHCVTSPVEIVDTLDRRAKAGITKVVRVGKDEVHDSFALLAKLDSARFDGSSVYTQVLEVLDCFVHVASVAMIGCIFFEHPSEALCGDAVAVWVELDVDGPLLFVVATVGEGDMEAYIAQVHGEVSDNSVSPVCELAEGVAMLVAKVDVNAVLVVDFTSLLAKLTVGLEQRRGHGLAWTSIECVEREVTVGAKG
jgi:hypothetical protein